MSGPEDPRIAQLERELAASRRTADDLREVLAEIPDPVLVTDDEGRFVWVCANVVHTLGYRSDQVEAMGSLTALLGDEAVQLPSVTGEVRNLEIDAMAQDGSPRRLLVNVKPCRVLGGSRLLMLRDVTDLRRTEDELAARELQLRHAQRMDAVGRLAGGVAHDFNNLLTAIVSFGEFLRGRIREDPEALDDLEQIIAAAGRGAELTGQLLLVSRHQPTSPRLVHPPRLLSGLGRLLQRLLGEDVALSLDADSDAGLVLIEPRALEQVIINLAVNARDAMPEGGDLTIAVRNQTLSEPRDLAAGAVPAGDYVVLAVSDTGGGVDPALVPQVFEPFYTTKEPGSGLGLATTYGIVTQAGGGIDVGTGPGQGAVFSVYLPRQEGASVGGDRDFAGPAPSGNGERILVVEDDAQIRKLASRGLGRLGYVVETAANVDVAMEKLESGAAFELIVTDIVMPGKSGRDLVREVAGRWPAVKILFMSGYDQELRLQRGYDADQLAFLAKPFTPPDLARKVREVLDADGYSAGVLAALIDQSS